jgi:quercetin dioxygenase-like cupin family protein
MMKIRDFREAPDKEEVPGVRLRVVISPEDGAPNFVMRVLEVEPGSSTPWHSHNWEHEVFILAGEGGVASEGGRTPIKANRVVFVAPNEMHQFVNSGFGVLRFICCIPRMD